ncbi:MAG: hypothetical protein C5B60_07675 [Chloroflexi bacterium]|nr:MAG: hypothetical protein C5B60_07675 [Chloroflexota bacterium]
MTDWVKSSDVWVPKHLKPANKTVNMVFYYSQKLDRILVGFPENYPAPFGFQKIVCRSAHEVEKWSERLRQQERRDDEMKDEEREAIEAPLREYARKELQHLMANARNNVNRDFCRQALQRIDEMERKNKMKTVRFMHAEGFEDGK